MALTDTFGRVHSDLRISVTDRCNLRCSYCMPETGAQFVPASALLSFDQIVRFVEASLPLGIRKIRITGGEPLLRPKLPELIGRLSSFPQIEDLALTTNGVLLRQHARALFDAGLRRINLHVDTLNRTQFARLTRRDELPRVLDGLEAAREAGFTRLKVNAVALSGTTADDLCALVDFGRARHIEVRFIEFMPLDGQGLWSLDRVLTADRMIEMLERRFGPLRVVSQAGSHAPASEYELPDGYRVGVIPSVTRPFCLACNRLRLTAEGRLRYCLFAREETDVCALLAPAASIEALQEVIRDCVRRKWIGHEIQQLSFIAPARPMYAIGG